MTILSRWLNKWPLCWKSTSDAFWSKEMENYRRNTRHFHATLATALGCEDGPSFSPFNAILNLKRDVELWKHASEIEHQIVTKRDKTILEQDEEIVKLQARLDALDVPGEKVPFCVDCHQGIKRGMPFHILTIRHGDCRFVGESEDSPAFASPMEKLSEHMSAESEVGQ